MTEAVRVVLRTLPRTQRTVAIQSKAQSIAFAAKASRQTLDVAVWQQTIFCFIVFYLLWNSIKSYIDLETTKIMKDRWSTKTGRVSDVSQHAILKQKGEMDSHSQLLVQWDTETGLSLILLQRNVSRTL